VSRFSSIAWRSRTSAAIPSASQRPSTNQLGLAKGPVPVAAIAAALDIVEIRTAATRGLEGALVTTEERSEGIIMVRAGATSQRRRFTVGHELGHFLNPEHKTTTETGFACTEKDLATPWPTFPDVGWQRVQEAEASGSPSSSWRLAALSGQPSSAARPISRKYSPYRVNSISAGRPVHDAGSSSTTSR